MPQNAFYTQVRIRTRPTAIKRRRRREWTPFRLMVFVIGLVWFSLLGIFLGFKVLEWMGHDTAAIMEALKASL